MSPMQNTRCKLWAYYLRLREFFAKAEDATTIALLKNWLENHPH